MKVPVSSEISIPIIHNNYAWYNTTSSLYYSQYERLLFLGDWTSPTVTGDRPPPINSFTLTSITNTTAILFGGDIDQDNESNALYIFEFANTSVVSVLKIYSDD